MSEVWPTGNGTEYELIAIDALTPHPENPRQGDVDLIVESIEANGFYGAVLAQRSSGHIIAGNHRWKAAKQVGMETIPVIWADVDDETALRILLADNRTSDLATYDNQALLDLLETLPALDGTGYQTEDLDELTALINDLPEPVELEAPRPGATNAVNTEGNGATGPLGLKEVIIVLNPGKLAEFNERIATLREQWEQETTSEIVLRAVEEAAAE